MSPWLFAVIFRPRVLVTETFTSSRTWVAPLTTTKIESMTGKGATGTPSAWTGNHDKFKVTTLSGPGETDDVTYEYIGTYSGSAPTDYCDAPEPYTSIGTGYTTRQVCYDFINEMATTTGASTTGFGQTFVGGTGGAATPSTVTNVAATAGASYPLVIPSGGSLSITYYR